MNLFFCGDIMPGGVLPYQDNYISSDLLQYMQSFDFRIGTLEAAIGTGLSYDPVKMAGRQNIVYARDEDFFRVKEMGFDVVSLANNHVWDLGEKGLKNTIKTLKENNIKYCGAGLNLEEASQPVILEKDGISIAILAYCSYGNPWVGYVELAKDNKPGINPLDINKVVSDIIEAKKKYDKVIVMPHWGREYRFEPLPECIAMAKRMIDAGADAVMGSHTHQIQPMVKYKKKPICYSMGNFMFPDFYMFPPRPIWYPQSLDEVQEIEDVVGYPYPIDMPIRQVWNPVSRFGYAINLSLCKNSIDAKYRFVHLSVDNIESFMDPDDNILHKLKIYSLSLNNNFFRIVFKSGLKVKKLLYKLLMQKRYK